MRKMIAFALTIMIASSTGCSMCAPGYLCDYAGVGGKWQRTNPECGRVGSTLSDAGEVMSDVVVASAVQPSEGVMMDVPDGLEFENNGDSGPVEVMPELVPAVEDGVILLGPE